MITPSQYIEARTIEIRIKCVDFTPFEVKNDSTTYTANLQYNIRWKGHFETEWHEIYIPTNGYAVGEKVGANYVVSYKGNYSPTEGLIMNSGFSATFPVHSQVDFQVEALIGYIHHVVVPGPFSGEVFEGEKSGWSDTQTLTIGEPTRTVTPDTPESSAPSNANVTAGNLLSLQWVGIAVVAIAVLLAIVVFYLGKRNSSSG